MMKAKKMDLMKLHQMNHSWKQYWRPYSKSSAFSTPPNQHVQKAPKIPATILNVTRKGIMVIKAAILGMMR